MQLLHRKDDMLHTVTDKFLADSYPTTRDKDSGAHAKASRRISVDPIEFRAKLARKIEELHKVESMNEEQILKGLASRGSDDSLKASMKNKMREM